MSKDIGAKDKDYYMEKVLAEEQRRIKQTEEREKEREHNGIEVKQKVARNNQGKTEATITISDKDRTLLDNNPHDLELSKDKNVEQQEHAPQVQNLRSSPTNNEQVKSTNIVNLRPQTQVAANDNHQIVNVKPPHLEHSFTLSDDALFKQLIEQVGQGVTHKMNQRNQEKYQQKLEQAQQQIRSR